MSYIFSFSAALLFFAAVWLLPTVGLVAAWRRKISFDTVLAGGILALAAAVAATTLATALKIPAWAPLPMLPAVFFCYRHLRGVRRGAALPTAPAALFGTIAALSLWVLLSNPYPTGWDPACHSMLAEKIRLSGEFSSDYRPFAEVKMNYPQSLHALLAQLANGSGAPVHVVFQMLHWVVNLLACAIIYRLAGTAFRSPAAANWTLALYAFAANWGAFRGYLTFGMLPTALGMLFFLGAIWSVTVYRRRWPALLLLGMTCWIHPYSWLLSLLGIVVLMIVDRSRARWWLPVYGGSLLFAAAMLGYKKFHIGTSGDTRMDSLKFVEEPWQTPGKILNDFGVFLFLLVLAGLALLIWHYRRLRNPRLQCLLAFGAAMAGGYLLLDVVFRFAVARPLFHEDFTLLIPSRFLMVLLYPAVMIAGYGAAELWRRGRFGKTAAAVLAAGAVLTGIRGFADLTAAGVCGPELQRLAAYARKNTGPGALLLLPEGIKDFQWFGYLAWRATLGDPIPSSENRAFLLERNGLFVAYGQNPAAVEDFLKRNRLHCVFFFADRQGKYHTASSDENGKFQYGGPL